MRKRLLRIAVAGVTLSAGSLAVAGTAVAQPGPAFDPTIHDLGVIKPCWQLPQGCVADPVDPVDPPADPPADPQPEPPTDPTTPTDPGTPTSPGGNTGGTQSTGAADTVEPAAATEAEPVVDRAAANDESSDSSAMPIIAFGVLGAALAALAVVGVFRLRGRALR